MNLYKVKSKIGEYFCLAESFDKAKEKIEENLLKSEFITPKGRETISVEIVGNESETRFL